MRLFGKDEMSGCNEHFVRNLREYLVFLDGKEFALFPASKNSDFIDGNFNKVLQ